MRGLRIPHHHSIHRQPIDAITVLAAFQIALHLPSHPRLPDASNMVSRETETQPVRLRRVTQTLENQHTAFLSKEAQLAPDVFVDSRAACCAAIAPASFT